MPEGDASLSENTVSPCHIPVKNNSEFMNTYETCTCMCNCLRNSFANISKLIFKVNYLLLTLSREGADFGERYYYIWHRGTDASFPTTTDETANGRITNSIWRQNTHSHTHMHIHTEARCTSYSQGLGPNLMLWDVLMIYESNYSISWSAVMFLSLSDSGLTHILHTLLLLFGASNVVAE